MKSITLLLAMVMVMVMTIGAGKESDADWWKQRDTPYPKFEPYAPKMPSYTETVRQSQPSGGIPTQNSGGGWRESAGYRMGMAGWINNINGS